MLKRNSTPANVKASQQSAPPKDALAALMEGETPDEKALRFADERQEDSYDTPLMKNSARKQPKSKPRFEQYDGDHTFDHKPNRSQGDYEYRPQDTSTLNTVKAGAMKSGTYVKDKSVAGATYLKEKDWTKEKEIAGHAGQAAKTGAIYVGSGVVKGAGWLWKSGKSGVDSLSKPKPTAK